jgi:hypothetical protein
MLSCHPRAHSTSRRARALSVAVILAALSIAHLAAAQSWLPPDRTTPALWEIISIDASGEPGWPFFKEDIAGDGLDRYDTLESRLDMHTVYVNREDNNRLWLRAYVASASQPPSSSRLYLFIDTDSDHLTGQQARGGASNEWPFFSTDPTEGGYERVIGVNGEGALIGTWRWDSTNNIWARENERAGAVEVEIGADRDRIFRGDNTHGYFQLNADADATGIDATCGARFFLRNWNVDPNDANDPALNFGDTDGGGAIACVPPDANQDGVPDIIYQTVTACVSDSDCPGNSYCFEQRVCVISYECVAARDCRPDEDCVGNVCVQVVPPDTCANDSACAPFVCDGQCKTCTQTGARACNANEVCLGDGRCVPDTTVGVVTCTSDAQCGQLVCDNNQCRLCTATGARACGAGDVCLTDGRCVPDSAVNAPCTTDAECGQLVCDAGQCQSCAATGARACNPGDVCQADGRCAPDGVPNTPCTSTAQCGQLVCDNNQCQSCTVTGARACGAGEVCQANGRCATNTGAGEDVLTLEPGERVQGGSCTCSALRAQGETRGGPWGACLSAAALGLAALVSVSRRHVRRQGGSR